MLGILRDFLSSPYLVKPSSSGTAGAWGFFKLFVCSLGKVSSRGAGGGEGGVVVVGFSSRGGDGGRGGPMTEHENQFFAHSG